MDMTIPAPPTPRRSRKRWFYIGGFVLLLLLAPLGLYHALNWWNDREMAALYQELDAEDPNWRWPDILAEIQPPQGDSNSAVQIVKVAALLKTTPFDTGPGWKREGAPRNARLSREDAKTLQKAFAKLDPQTVPEARKLKDLPTGGFAIKDASKSFFLINLDEVQSSRSVMNLLSHDALQRGHHGDHTGAIESCQALTNTARWRRCDRRGGRAAGRHG